MWGVQWIRSYRMVDMCKGQRKKNDYKALASSSLSDCTWLELKICSRHHDDLLLHFSWSLQQKTFPSSLLLYIIFFSFSFFLSFSLSFLYLFLRTFFELEPSTHGQLSCRTSSQIRRTLRGGADTLGRPAKGVYGWPAKPLHGSASVRSAYLFQTLSLVDVCTFLARNPNKSFEYQ